MQSKMSVSQTYYLAHTARSKLSSEAARGDHNLRRLVGHANLLDVLTIELQEAERAQEAIYNNAIKATSKKEAKHISWSTSIVEVSEDLTDYEVDDVDSDDDDFFEDAAQILSMAQPLAHINSTMNFMLPPSIEDDEDEEEDEDEDMADLALARIPSRSSQPPELTHDYSDDSDDDSAASPPVSPAETSAQGIIAMDFAYNYNMKSKPTKDDYYLSQHTSPMIAAC